MQLSKIGIVDSVKDNPILKRNNYGSLSKSKKL